MTKLNYQKMEKIFRMKFKDFVKYLPYNKESDYYFKDNGSNILAVAHLDTVIKCTNFIKVSLPHKDLVFSPVHDDRLGAYLILEHLPKLGIQYDILLTNNEERGASTASKFVTEKKYNWIFSFDRSGTDVVMYEYETGEMRKLLAKHNLRVGSGSYSCIADLEHLGCKAFNFGTAYYGQHTLDSYADMEELQKMITKFCAFYSDNSNIHLPHTQSYFQIHRYHGKYWEDWDKRWKSKKKSIEDGYGSYNEEEEFYEEDGLEYECEYCGEAVDLSLFKEDELYIRELYSEQMCFKCFSEYYLR